MVTVAAQALAALDLGQSSAMCPFSPQERHKPSFKWRSLSSLMSLPFFPNLSEMGFFGLSFEEEFLFGVEEVEFLLFEDWDWLQLLLELEVFLLSFLPDAFSELLVFLDSMRASSSCIQ